MLKRKSSVNKTLIKSKPISHYSNLKQTVKTKMVKSLKAGGRNSIRNSLRRSLRDLIAMKDNLNKSNSFAICNDQELLQGKVIIPSIEMIYDNDEESEWG